MNNFLLKNVLVLFVISFIAFQSCNKDTSLTELKTPGPTEQKILNFKEKMKNPDKSGETMSIEDAVWNIEAALNYTHCNAEVNEVIGIDSIFVTINLTNGEINFNDIIVAYQQLNADLVNVIGENTMRLADIDLVEDTNKSNEQEFKLTVLKAPAPDIGRPIFIGNFGPDDNWRAGLLAGSCDGQGYGRDAATEIGRKANYLSSYPANGYITDVTILEFYGYAYPQYLFNIGGSGNNSQNPCLESTELNYWLSKIKLLANDYKPVGLHIANYECGSAYFNEIGGGWGLIHYAYITYGEFHYREIAIN